MRARLVSCGSGLLTATLLLSSCGYHFTARRDALPTGGRRVFAPTFANDTSEAGIEAEFTNAFRAELADAHADGESDAPIRALGTVSGLGGGPDLPLTDAHGNAVGLASYQVGVQLCVRLVEGERPLGSTCVRASEPYAPGLDPLQTESARRLALHRMAEKLAREAFEHLASAF